MKTILAILFSALLPTSAFAWWIPQGNVIVNHNVIEAAVYNNTPVTVFCRGFVQGQTQFGQVYTNGFAQYVAPMTYAYANYVATPPHYFVSGFADIRCQ